MSLPTWLPPLLEYAAFGGDYPRFFDAVYARFSADFITSKPTVKNRRFALKRHPEFEGKSATFWHLVSSGSVEADREPDLRRMEAIPWVRPIIERMGSGDVHCWLTDRKGETRILVSLLDYSYLVILAERGDTAGGRFVMLWTAYFVEHENQRRRLQREHEAWLKAQKG